MTSVQLQGISTNVCPIHAPGQPSPGDLAYRSSWQVLLGVFAYHPKWHFDGEYDDYPVDLQYKYISHIFFLKLDLTSKTVSFFFFGPKTVLFKASCAKQIFRVAEVVTLVGAAPIIRSQQAGTADLSVQDLNISHHGTGGFRVKSVELP